MAHRDNKPKPLLLLDLYELKVSDFGIATISRKQGNGCWLETSYRHILHTDSEVLLMSNHNVGSVHISLSGSVWIDTVTKGKYIIKRFGFKWGLHFVLTFISINEFGPNLRKKGIGR